MSLQSYKELVLAWAWLNSHNSNKNQSIKDSVQWMADSESVSFSSLIQSGTVRTPTSAPGESLKCQFEGVLAAGISATVSHRLALCPACNSWRGDMLTVTDSKDQREVKTEGQSPSVNLSSLVLTRATWWLALGGVFRSSYLSESGSNTIWCTGKHSWGYICFYLIKKKEKSL